MNQVIDKEILKKSIVDNVKTLYRRTIEEVSNEQVFQAVSYTIKDLIIDKWITTHREYEKKRCKNSLLYVYGIFDGASTWE